MPRALGAIDRFIAHLTIKAASLPYRSEINYQEESNMKLLTDELRAQLPALYAQETEKDKMVYIKFFSPFTNWTWFVTEGSQEEDDFIFFGYVIGFEKEWGYFALSELQSTRGVPAVERDLHFTPKRQSEIPEMN
jgi:Protein of unknown function (DUF2958)